MPSALYDAHVHLAAALLTSAKAAISQSYDDIQLKKAIVIGTSPADWPKVVEFATNDERFIPAVGLHPWKVNDAPANWQDQLLKCLDQGVGVMGEIGLDQWIDDFDIERQIDAFEWQISLAVERNLPTSIHCLKAHDPLVKTLRSIERPGRGFKLHAYNGPVDTIKPLLDLGAYFSFNGGQLKPNAKNVREIIQTVPGDRILMETDAPNFVPPLELREFTLGDESLCHPANLRAGYRAVAKLRGESLDDFTHKVALNFQRYFDTTAM